MCKSDIIDTKPAISQKRSSLQPQLLQSVYRNSCTTFGDKSDRLGWTLAYFSGKENFCTRDISHTFCRSATKFGRVRGLANRHSPNLVNFGPIWYHAAICINPSQFADSFRLMSIHCVAWNLTEDREINGESTSMVWPTLGSRTAKEQNSVAWGLAGSFLYKCPASRCSSLRRHGLLVYVPVPSSDRL